MPGTDKCPLEFFPKNLTQRTPRHGDHQGEEKGGRAELTKGAVPRLSFFLNERFEEAKGFYDNGMYEINVVAYAA